MDAQSNHIKFVTNQPNPKRPMEVKLEVSLALKTCLVGIRGGLKGISELLVLKVIS